MGKRVGRPNVEKPKYIKYSIRLDEDMERRLRRYCADKMISKGAAIREGIEMLLRRWS